MIEAPRTARIWLLVAAVALLAGCGRVQNERFTDSRAGEPEGVAMQLSLPGEHAVDRPGELTITLEKEGVPLEGVTVHVEGNMTHAGMEPLLVEATEVAPGSYRAELAWTMAGQWFVTAEATLPDGGRVTRMLDDVQVSAP